MSAMDELMRAFQVATNAEIKHDNEFKAFQGDAWDWFKHDAVLIQAKQKAYQHLRQSFEKTIDERVALAISKI